MSVLDSEAGTSIKAESDDDTDSILPDVPSKTSGIGNTSTSSNSVLQNCPDITIIKKEKIDGTSSKLNNNSDHSSKQSGNSD